MVASRFQVIFFRPLRAACPGDYCCAYPTSIYICMFLISVWSGDRGTAFYELRQKKKFQVLL